MTNKKRKNIFSGGGSGDEHIDVNEQELAKDTRGADEVTDEVENLAVNQRSDANDVSESIDAVAQEDAPSKSAENIPRPTNPLHSVVRLDTDKEKADKKFDEGPDEGNGKKRRRGGLASSFIYVSVIILCLAASIGVLVFSAVEGNELTDTNEENSEFFGSETASPPSVPADESVSLLSAEEIYALGFKSSVTVRSNKNGVESVFSGVGVFGDGYVATLYSAVGDSKDIAVEIWDGSRYSAELIGGSPEVNLALLKIDALTLEYVNVGSSELLMAGNELYAVGSTCEGRYSSSLVAGEVAYVGRLVDFDDFEGKLRRARVVQTSGLSDEALRGCPVFNSYGEAIGITLSSSNDSDTGFFIPLDAALGVLDALKNGVKPSEELLRSLAFFPPSLGILGEQGQENEIWGVKITEFSKKDSDSAAKLRVGDLIFRINETLVTDTAALRSEIEKHVVGDEVEIFVYRNGQRLSFFVKLS